MKNFTILPILMLLGVAGCTSPPTQYQLDAPTSDLRLRAVVSSLEVRDVSLPQYASAADGIALQQPDGSVKADPKEVWADTPERATTLALARNLAAITGTRVAAEPWPFADLPAASVTVVVERFLAAQGTGLRLQGAYAISPVGSSLSDRGGRFDIAIPLPENAATTDIARAHGLAIERLAEEIARRISG
ncbi:PqiC family protein [Mangrovicoccus algicola]|uniref:Membrane integrity-associated transporter subunit PqiC n=1 Tax=Mangrovicoccus algicola TaxID=2771008 RepID=A0A8J7CI66_9RHOB|nr:ABC-type transport auxiliary lipoprotein family protein [Mangrovicoccus algicola]MBE3639210.1 membrane integrity-associated transporter subunit PqiC [Mangrovicoccus algicola]